MRTKIRNISLYGPIILSRWTKDKTLLNKYFVHYHSNRSIKGFVWRSFKTFKQRSVFLKKLYKNEVK